MWDRVWVARNRLSRCWNGDDLVAFQLEDAGGMGVLRLPESQLVAYLRKGHRQELLIGRSE